MMGIQDNRRLALGSIQLPAMRSDLAGATSRRVADVRIHRASPRRVLLILAILALLWMGPQTPPTFAQGLEGRAVPRQGYFLAFQPLRRGEYREALRAFRSAANSGINTGQGRWVDSICYYTMIGECLYHLGDYGGALGQYDAALNLMIARHGWLKRVQLPPAIAPVAGLPAIPWGPTARNALPGGFPDTMLSLQGTDIDAVLQQGGTVVPPELYPVRVMEIMRCIGVALKRRAEILGPLASQTPLTGQLVKELSRSQIPPGHWMQSLVDVQLGLAKIASGDKQEALALLQRSAAINGRFDHPLTPIALIMIGQLSLDSGDMELAQRSFFEASFPAVYFEQARELEEAIVSAARVHMIRGEAGVFPPLATGADWAIANDLDRAAAAMFLSAAENAATHGQTAATSTLMAQSRRAMGRSDLPASDLGAAWSFLTALVAYQSSSIAVGDKAFDDSLRLLAQHSRRLFQLELASRLYRTKELTPRVAGLLFENLLREPTADDWRLRPAETLLLEASPLDGPMQQWLEIALERGEMESMVLVSDMIRRHKFYRQLKLGGRLLALRWVTEAPEVALSPEARQQRQQIFARYPDVQARSQRLAELKAALAGLPLSPEDAEEQKGYARITQDLMKLADEQEIKLHELALSPIAAERIFPPLLTLDQLQSRLQPGQAVLSFVDTGRGMHALLMTNQKQYRHWQLGAQGTIRRDLTQLMRDIGNYDRNQVLPADRLTNESWKDIAANLTQAVAKELNNDGLNGIEELVIVPDGVLWYLPFEMLQIQQAGQRQTLIDVVRLRYAPTMGLAVPDGRPAETAGPRAIVQGRLFSRDNQSVVADAAEQLRAQHPRSTILRKRLPVTTQYVAPVWQQLIVLDDVELNEREPLAWSPAQIDQGKPGGVLKDWMQLPFGAPDVVVLPGYQTLAENGLRGRPNGDEVMVATCGLMAAGSRTLVIARWRTGGQMSMEVVREFLQVLPQESAASAWQRAILLARSAELDPASEPRLKDVKPGEVPTAAHPFFWAGYLMMGTR